MSIRSFPGYSHMKAIHFSSIIYQILKLRRLILLSVFFVGAFVLLFWPTFMWMAERFDAYNSFYSHGWIIPLASGWLIWNRRNLLKTCPRQPSFWGLSFIIPSLLLHLLASWVDLHFLSGFAMLSTLWGLIWMLWGFQVLWIMRFPMLFLLFMIPIPSVLLISTSFQMKMMAASLATHLLTLIGITAIQEGSTIHLHGISVIVDDTCSGLRSLISLLALSVLWTSLLPHGTKLWKKLTLVASAVPIALLTNMIRIMVLVLLSAIYGSQIADSFLHYGSGFVVFGLAIVLLTLLSRQLVGKHTFDTRATPPGFQTPALKHTKRSYASTGVLGIRPQLVAFTLLILTSMALFRAQSPHPSLGLESSRIPVSLGPWKGTPIPVTDDVIRILETEDIALMEYRLDKEPPLWFAQVAGYGNRGAYHPPELCFVGSHFEILERGVETVEVNGKDRQVMRLVISQDGQHLEAWYWFTANGRITPNYYQQQLWLVMDAMRRKPMLGSLVRISTPIMDDAASAHNRLQTFMTSLETHVRASSDNKILGAQNSAYYQSS